MSPLSPARPVVTRMPRLLLHVVGVAPVMERYLRMIVSCFNRQRWRFLPRSLADLVD